MEISTSEIGQVVDRLWRRFQIAAKITGAGGGGCLISFPFDRKSHSIPEIEDVVKKVIPGATVQAVRPAPRGTLIESVHEEKQMRLSE